MLPSYFNWDSKNATEQKRGPTRGENLGLPQISLVTFKKKCCAKDQIQGPAHIQATGLTLKLPRESSRRLRLTSLHTLSLG